LKTVRNEVKEAVFKSSRTRLRYCWKHSVDRVAQAVTRSEEFADDRLVPRDEA
jgi:hypothetical protein